jgi:hypothetical protein
MATSYRREIGPADPGTSSRSACAVHCQHNGVAYRLNHADRHVESSSVKHATIRTKLVRYFVAQLNLERFDSPCLRVKE